MTWNSDAMSSIGSIVSGSRKIYAYYLINPDTGNNTLEFTHTGSTETTGIFGVSLYGADQTDPIGDTQSQNVDNTSGTSFNITTEDDGAIVVNAVNYEGSTGSVDNPPSTFTSVGVATDSGMDSGCAYKTVASAGSTAAGWGHSSVIDMVNLTYAVDVKQVQATSTSTTTSTSTSTSTSTTTSTTTTLDPDSGGLAFGEETPTMSESAVSWQTWSDGAGSTQDVSGDQDWGKLSVAFTEEGRSAVYDFSVSQTRTITLTENRYGTGQGTATLQIRGHDSTKFNQDDASPSWETYSAPIGKTWRYIQVRELND
jgi:hypothetical protein